MRSSLLEVRRGKFAGRAAAAIFGKVGDELVHRGEVGAVDQRAALPLRLDQPGALQLGEMERQAAVGQVERLSDAARGHALPAGLDEQPEQSEAMLLRQSGKTGDHRVRLHRHPHVSINVEMSWAVLRVKNVSRLLK